MKGKPKLHNILSRRYSSMLKCEKTTKNEQNWLYGRISYCDICRIDLIKIEITQLVFEIVT